MKELTTKELLEVYKKIEEYLEFLKKSILVNDNE